MTVVEVDDFSVNITAFFMKLIGVWFHDNRFEQILRSFAWWFTIGTIVFGVYLQTTIISHFSEDFENGFFGLLNLLSMTVPMSKMMALVPHREKFFRLVLYMVDNFLKADYDAYERSIITNIKRKCSFFVCSTSIFTELCIFAYVIAPLVVNVGRNSTTRIMPFKMWVSFPVLETPYFQIFYLAQTVASFSIGFAYFCIDNMLCIMNLHLSAQFKILQYRISDKCTQSQNKSDEKSDMVDLPNDGPAIFKNCIQQHQTLIQYCEEIQQVFGFIVLAQVMAFSLFICLDGYQVLLVELVQRKIIFFFHLLSTIVQLVMLSYSCDCISYESSRLAIAVYSGPWQLLPPTRVIKSLKKDMLMLIMRANIPCCISGSGFFIVSLETCTRVLTTAASYFTLLRQTRDEITA